MLSPRLINDMLPSEFTDAQRIFITFLVFGLVNNILYVVILSAAIDLVGSATPKGVVLLADIMPSLLIKALAPFQQAAAQVV